MWKRSGLACAAFMTGVVLTDPHKRILNHVRAGSTTPACYTADRFYLCSDIRILARD